MKGKRLIVRMLVGLSVFATSLWLVDNYRKYAQCAFPLEVQFESRTNRKVVRVFYEYFPNSVSVAEVRPHLDQVGFYGDRLENSNGKGVEVPVPCSRVTSPFREVHYSEYKLAALKLEYEDGTVDYEIVEVPAGRGRRSVTLQIP